MPVAANQIVEIMQMLQKEIEDPVVLKRVVRKMKRTQAYRKNSSFRITIDRMLTAMDEN